MKPKFPIVSIFNRGLDKIPNESYLRRATVYGILKGNKDAVAFDSNGKKWSYQLHSEKVVDNLITRLLANTFYNPIVEVTPKWTEKGEYQIRELKELLCDCVDMDDDILTQFIDSETLKTEFKNSNSFEQITAILDKYVFEVNEDEI